MFRPSFGAGLPHVKRTWPEIRDAALGLEARGFESLWLDDHLYGNPRPELPIFEAWTTLSALGAATSKAKLGLLVSPPAFRSPALLAKMIATLDAVTGGRVYAGVGAGWFEEEARGYGLPFPGVRERLEQLEEMITILRLMWTEERPTFHGRHYRIDSVYCEPRPSPPPAILIGGSGEKVLLRIVAKHADIWNNPSKGQPELERKIEVLKRHCREVGRDFDSITISQHAVVVLHEDERQARAVIDKAQSLYGWKVGDLAGHGIAGTPEQVIEAIERHLRLGVRHFILEFYGRDVSEPIGLFAERVMPAFRR